jgi:hypothetical protein
MLMITAKVRSRWQPVDGLHMKTKIVHLMNNQSSLNLNEKSWMFF